MSEKELNDEVILFCREKVDLYRNNIIKRSELPELEVRSMNLYTGSVPWWTEDRKWEWKSFKRQIDVVIGIKAEIDGEEELIPLIVVELKSGKFLNTDELDKKSAIYGPLREVYPWVHTVFMHRNMKERNMDEVYLLRNARHFDTIYTEWDDRTKSLFEKLINQQLEYLLEYWKL